MDAFPALSTPRLTLTKINVADIPALVKYANNKKVSNNLWNIPYPYTEADGVFRISYVHQGFKNGSSYVFAVILKETSEFIGETSLHLGVYPDAAQLGYWIAEPFWNKGFCTEATRAIITFAFEKLQLGMVYAECHVDNKASEHVLLNNRMSREAVRGNVALYQLTKSKYKEFITGIAR